MESVDNNQFEVKPNNKTKRKIVAPCPNAYLNPALDLLANEDPMCNTAMEIVPVKKRKQAMSCDIAAFENSALDLGISKAAVNEFLQQELENVRKNVRQIDDFMNTGAEVNAENNTTLAQLNLTNDIEDNIVHSNVPEKIHPKMYVSELSYARNFMNTRAEVFMMPRTTLAEVNLTNNIEVTMKNNKPENTKTKLDIREPIYANLADVPMPEINPVIDKAVTTLNTDDIIDVPIVETSVGTSLNTQNIMEISKFDEELDSGISVLEQKSITNFELQNNDLSAISHIKQTNVTNQMFVNNINNGSGLNLSFIDRLALDSPNMSNKSLYLDDDLNESNIMEIKTITIITKKKRIPDKNKSTNPFLDPNLGSNIEVSTENPFLDTGLEKSELEYTDEVMHRPVEIQAPPHDIMPRRLFTSEINNTVSTENDSISEQHEYENIDGYRSESPIYENVTEDGNEAILDFNKQSKILGHDVSRFSAIDIMNLNKNNQANSSNESNDSKKDLKYQFLKAGKLSKKVLKKLKNTFKHDKIDNNVTLNPYEVPRKIPKHKTENKESGIENPALNLDLSDIEIEEVDSDEEHQYETIKTLRNTRMNMNVTPLKERAVDNIDTSNNRSNTPSKKVRFDSTLNQEKVITGNSFDYGIQSPGFDAKIDKYHDELENCINEKKYLQQNM